MESQPSKLSNVIADASTDGTLQLLSLSTHEREELAYSLLVTLPRARLADIRKRIDPLLQLDVVGLLPNEVAFEVLSYLPWQSLLKCSLVCRRWYVLANDGSLWKRLCSARGCAWRQLSRPAALISSSLSLSSNFGGDTDDEGMGDEEEVVVLGHDSGFVSINANNSIINTTRSILANFFPNVFATQPTTKTSSSHDRRSALSTIQTLSVLRPNYKLLHQTRTRLYNRFLSASYRLSTLQTRPAGSTTVAAAHNLFHTSTIYCLQLYTYPETGLQTLFTGSKDKSIREWNIHTSQLMRVIQGTHSSSVLNLCADRGLLASAGSDQRVCVWDLKQNELFKSIRDHQDSVLSVRFDERRLVSCSKDRTLRTYRFPNLDPHLVLVGHRAAVNTIVISGNMIFSGSGDRSMRVWDADTGNLIKVFEGHHSRGIASIDVRPPFILSGSSDKHIRMIDLNSGKGWSTNSDFDVLVLDDPEALRAEVEGDEEYASTASAYSCSSCGAEVKFVGALDRFEGADSRAKVTRLKRYSSAHSDLVRSVVMNDDWVVSGSYDSNIKIWNRKTGAFVADLSGGHTGRVFCVGLDCTKIVSVGEDQRICVWDFSHGIDTSFVEL